MKTPVDPVIRIQRREVDALKRQISEQIDLQTELLSREASISEEIQAQYRIASTDWALSVHAFARRKLWERACFARQRQEAEAELDRLRGEAAEAFGRLRAAEEVAERHRAEMRETTDRAEQAAADDFAISRYLTLAARRKVKGDRPGEHEQWG